MLITELKAKETILSLITGKVFVLNCHGCKEIRFPEAEANEFQKTLTKTGYVTTEYICSSKLPLVNMIKMGKNGVRGMK